MARTERMRMVETERLLDRFYSELQKKTTDTYAPLFDLQMLEEWARENDLQLDAESLGQALTRIIRRRKGKLVVISAHSGKIIFSRRPLMPRY